MNLKKKKIKKTTKKSTKKTVKPAVKKTTPRKLLKKKISKKSRRSPKKPAIKTAKSKGILVGLITHYFPHVQAAVIKLKASLAKGDTVQIKGHTTDITQIVTSMQINRIDIQTAKKGDEIGLQVSSRVRQQDKIYKI
jgi:predicted ribosome-associated RNA-binding protein Tma20